MKTSKGNYEKEISQKTEKEKEVVETYLMNHQFMSEDEIKKLENGDIHNIYKSICMESFDIVNNIKYGNNVKIDGKDYTVNPIVENFYSSIKSTSTCNKLYVSNNTKLFSSIDYMVNNGKEYSINPIIPYYIYYNLVPKSLDFELMIPFIPSDFKTTMSICGCDLMNGCSENNLIPFVFSYKKNLTSNKIIDPLFEIDDVENVRNMEFADEDLEKKEGFLNLFRNLF